MTMWLRSGVAALATTAVAMAFGPLAGAGLLDDNAAVNNYRPRFSIALAQAAGNDEARLRARGFMGELEKAVDHSHQ